MDLILNKGDLKPEHKSVDPPRLTFEMFDDAAQKAIIAVGSGLWEGNQNHKPIYPPE